MSARKRIASWPVVRQLTGSDRLALGEAAQLAHSTELIARTKTGQVPPASAVPYGP